MNVNIGTSGLCPVFTANLYKIKFNIINNNARLSTHQTLLHQVHTSG